LAIKAESEIVIAMSFGPRQSLKTVLNNPQCAEAISRTLTRPRPSMNVTAGFQPTEPGLDDMTGTTLLTQPLGVGPSTAQMSVADLLMRKWGQAAIGPALIPAPKKQKKQTCQKCARAECPGSSGRAKCEPVCRDCRLQECPGQEEKPDTPCLNYCNWENSDN
jgi:hypothetical protein